MVEPTTRAPGRSEQAREAPSAARTKKLEAPQAAPIAEQKPVLSVTPATAAHPHGKKHSCCSG